MKRYSHNNIIIITIVIIIIIIIIIILNNVIMLEFLSARFIHRDTLLPFYFYLTRVEI